MHAHESSIGSGNQKRDDVEGDHGFVNVVVPQVHFNDLFVAMPLFVVHGFFGKARAGARACLHFDEVDFVASFFAVPLGNDVCFTCGTGPVSLQDGEALAFEETRRGILASFSEILVVMR